MPPLCLQRAPDHYTQPDLEILAGPLAVSVLSRLFLFKLQILSTFMEIYIARRRVLNYIIAERDVAVCKVKRVVGYVYGK